MATTEQGEFPPVSGGVPRTSRIPLPGPRRIVKRSVMVRRVDPWSVLKLSLVFYFCVLLIGMVTLTLFWSMLNRLGVVESLLKFLADLRLQVTINADDIARVAFLLGLLNVILWTGLNVFLAFLYNLVADLIGGLRVTLAEEE